jgi:hypothetical protein
VYPGGQGHHTEIGLTTLWYNRVGPVNQLAADLGSALGCPVEVGFLPGTREVVAVAYPRTPREIRVALIVSPVALRVIDNPFAAVKCDLLKQLRQQLGQRLPGA